MVVTMTCSVALGPVGGDLHVCLPYSMIEPIRDVLSSTIQEEPLEKDVRWARMLTSQLDSAEVEVRANLTQVGVTLDQILNMKVGDVIPIEIPDTVLATVHGVPLLDCKYGMHRQRYALRVERVLTANPTDPHTGDVHA
jgi:flagellar motor switch protein FliM